METNNVNLRYQVIQVLVSFIYKQVEERREEQLQNLIKRNDILVMKTNWIFSYAGKRWTQHRFVRPPQNVPYLDDSLHPEMDEYLAEAAVIEQEKPMVHSYLRQILNSDSDVATALSRIPSALHSPILPAMQAAWEELGDNTVYDFTQAAELTGAYPKAAEAIRLRMMTNVLLE